MTKIPKIIHQIFLNEKRNDIPLKFKKYIEGWKNKHPEWKIILWGEHNIESLKYFKKKDFNKLINVVEKSDYLRIIILREFGGIYADLDTECIKNFLPLCKYSFFIGQENNEDKKKYLCNAIIGSEKEGRIIKIITKFQQKKLKNHPNVHRIDYIGTKFINDTILKEKLTTKERIFWTEYFHPKPYWIKDDPSCYKITQNTYCIHHYSGSWLSKKQKFLNFIKRYPIWNILLNLYAKIKQNLKKLK